MRRIGTLTDPDQARRFADFLFTLSIECNVDIEEAPAADGAAGGKQCNLWIRDESHVERAKQELESFLQSPTDEKYRVGDEAERIRKQRQSEEKRKKRLQQKVNPKSPATGAGPLMGVPTRQQTIPVVIAMVVLSVIASFSTGFGSPKKSQVPDELSTEETNIYGLSFVDWRDYVIGKDPLASIKQGEIWRLVTPLFLHGDTYQLAFNMLGIFFLGSAIERLEGSWFLAPADALPPMLAGLAGSPFSIGASGAVYGLFGYLWIRPALSPSYPVRMMPSNVAIMLGWLVFCIFFVERIANGAHIGGLVAGVVIAVVISRMPSDRFA